jgi:hypothetical protein
MVVRSLVVGVPELVFVIGEGVELRRAEDATV